MSLQVGIATHDITPTKPMFLVGYPHVPRTSTGTHDPLGATAFYLADGGRELMTIALDLCYICHEDVRAWRAEIERRTGIPSGHILISPTHTHSGPNTDAILAWRADLIVPPPDPEYMKFLGQHIIETAAAAKQNAQPARLAITTARAEGVGCNRLDPKGPHDPEVGILCARRRDNDQVFALLLIYSMHPTVLHEDSTLFTGDFIAYTRQHLQEALPGVQIAYHNGTSGNLSPRHHVKGQTFAEAERLGRKLGEQVLAVVRAVRGAEFRDSVPLAATADYIAPPTRRYPPVAETEANLKRVQAEYERLKRDGAPKPEVRTAECALFGAQFMDRLAREEASGEADKVRQRYRQVEVQALRIGDAFIVALPGEHFVEYGLRIKKEAPGRAFVITMANGDMQGYIVTPEAEAASTYEAQFRFFPSAAGDLMAATAVMVMRGVAG